MLSGPVCCMVWQGENAVKMGRQMLGATNPQESLPGTIRGDFSIVVGRNICHGSDSAENAEKEIALWFKDGEVRVEIRRDPPRSLGWLQQLESFDSRAPTELRPPAPGTLSHSPDLPGPSTCFRSSRGRTTPRRGSTSESEPPKRRTPLCLWNPRMQLSSDTHGLNKMNTPKRCIGEDRTESPPLVSTLSP